MSRKGRHYKAYLDASVADKGEQPVPYSTLRRWHKTGRVSKERLKELGFSLRQKNGPKGVQIHVDDVNAGSVPSPSTSSQTQCVPELRPLSSQGIQNSADVPSVSANVSKVEICDSVGTSSVTTGAEQSRAMSSDFSIFSGSFDEVISNVSGYGMDDLEPEKSDLSSVLSSQFIGPHILNEPLHPNLAVTKFETLLMILHLSMRHTMTDTFLEDLFSFVNQIVGVPNALQVSKHLFHKLFMFGSSPSMHFYCPYCKTYLGVEKSFPSGLVKCDTCDWSNSVASHNGGYYFLSLGLRDQIRDVLSKPNLKLVSRQKRSANVVSDVMDGQVYQSLSKDENILSNPDALTLTFNIDASPIFKSDPYSLWPVHFYINEIEPLERFNADNILLGGLWFGKSEANVQVFLQPFLQELKELESNGVVWTRADGTVVESPVYALACCTDSVTKPKVQCHLEFSGSFACGYCEHPNPSVTVLERVERHSGLVIGNQNINCSNASDMNASEVYHKKKVKRYVRGNYKLRTNRELRKHMRRAAESGHDHVMGATGVSVVCELKYFNVVYGFIIDYMHNVLLGTVKQLAGYWFDSDNSSHPYYIGSSIYRVDMRLEDIRLPSGFRTPRPMSDRRQWKADEWRAFLLYFGLPVLINVLPFPFYNHFKKLVTAIYILTKESMMHDEADYANNLLQEFVWEYQDLYGEVNMVYNVHITTHIAQIVAKMGPLWAYSAFPFKSASDRLVKLAIGSKGVATQVCRKYVMTKGVSKLLRSNYLVRDEVLHYCCDVIGYKCLEHANKGRNNETQFGRQFYYQLNDAQKQTFINRNIPCADLILVLNRFVDKGRIYYGRLTTRQKRASDSCVRLTSGDFAVIDLIICNPKQFTDECLTDCLFLVTKLNIATELSPLLVPHIKQCSVDSYGEIELVSSTDIAAKCIFFSFSDKNFVVEISNFYETA